MDFYEKNMNKSLPLINMLQQLWVNILPRRRKQFKYLLILMILTSIAEIVSIGATLPFLAALTDPDQLFEKRSIKFIFEFLSLIHI